MTRTTPPRPPPSPTRRAATETQVVSEPPFLDDEREPAPPVVLPRATVEQRPVQLPSGAEQPRSVERGRGEPTRRPDASDDSQTQLARTGARARRPSKLPYVRQEIVGVIDERSHLPSLPPRIAGELARVAPDRVASDRGPAAPSCARAVAPAAPLGTLPPLADATLPPPTPAIAHATPAITHATPAITHAPTTTLAPPTAYPPDRDASGARPRPRGTPGHDVGGAQIRTLIFAPERSRAAWIERELSHAPITIQVGRNIRTLVVALTRDPPPRPDVLIIDFDSVCNTDLFDLHEIRQEGWTGRLIALGSVPAELRASLGIDEVFAPPLVRDSLLDCVAGTRHAAVTTVCPVLPPSESPSDDSAIR